MYNEMMCLVGQNPLPVYLGIAQLANANAKVVLLASKDTEVYANNILAALGKSGVKRDVRVNPARALRDPHDPKAVREDIELNMKAATIEPATCALNYTGGTKVMSAYALLAWKCVLENTFYLDEGSSAFFLHSGHSIKLDRSNRLVDLEILTDLHGTVPAAPCAPPLYIADDLTAVWQWMRGNVPAPIQDLTRKSNKEKFRWLRNYVGNNLEAGDRAAWDDFFAMLSHGTQTKWIAQPQVPSSFAQWMDDHAGEFQCKHASCTQMKFVTGGWMECLVYEILKGMSGNGQRISLTGPQMSPMFDPANLASHLSMGQVFRIGVSPDVQIFEADIVATYKNRLIYLSVTTSSAPSTAKSKMFQAIHRSNQIGGGMARVAVISMMKGDDNSRCFSSAGSTRHVFFGFDDVDGWIKGNGSSLYQFMTRGI